MLSYFRIQNFKSILDLTIDLSFAENKAPKGYKESEYLYFVGNKPDARFVPVLALYGANASGKTNILEALHCFKYILAQGVMNVGCYNPNKLNPKYDFTTFEIGVNLEGKLYKYLIQYNQDGIIKEGLYDDSQNELLFEINKCEVQFNKIATEEYTPERLNDIFGVECSEEYEESNKKLRRQWKPFLTCIGKNYKGLNNSLLSIWKYLTFSVETFFLFDDIPFHNKLLSSLKKLAGAEINKTKDSGKAMNLDEAMYSACEKIASLLKKLDFDIVELALSRQSKHIIPGQGISIPCQERCSFIDIKWQDNLLVKNDIYSFHTDIKGEKVKFKFSEESEGTQTVFVWLGICLSALEEGKVVFIDELERSLHPKLLIEVIRLFKNKRYNKKNAQLVFTAHNTDILEDDLMRASEIGIVNKTKKTGTTINRISDFKGNHNNCDFRKQYLDGLFGGNPFPYI